MIDATEEFTGKGIKHHTYLSADIILVFPITYSMICFTALMMAKSPSLQRTHCMLQFWQSDMPTKTLMISPSSEQTMGNGIHMVAIETERTSLLEACIAKDPQS
jgi:hypothetical protein